MESGEKRPLFVARICKTRLPAHDQFLRVGKLPDTPSAPVTDRLPESEIAILTKPGAQVRRLAYIEDTATVKPVRRQRWYRNGRILQLESATGILAQERRRFFRVANDYVDSRHRGNRGYIEGKQPNETLEVGFFKGSARKGIHALTLEQSAI